MPRNDEITTFEISFGFFLFFANNKTLNEIIKNKVMDIYIRKPVFHQGLNKITSDGMSA